MQMFGHSFSSNIMYMRVPNRCKPVLFQEFRGVMAVYYLCGSGQRSLHLLAPLIYFQEQVMQLLYSKQEIKTGSSFQLM